jgi:outer membrane protein assembly factor BamB
MRARGVRKSIHVAAWERCPERNRVYAAARMNPGFSVGMRRRVASWALASASAIAPWAAADSGFRPGSDAISGASLIAAQDDGWPQLRGPRRDGVSAERGLLASWPKEGPPRLWSATGIGRGFSSPVISAARLIITGDDRGELRLIAMDLNGGELWRAQNGLAWTREYPGARSSAVISEGRVYHLNAHGRLACFDARDGRELWSAALLEQFDAENINWGISECPVVDERAVYATAGGRKALVVALDKRTGELIWQSPPLHDADEPGKVETAGYVSPILARFGERRLLIGCSLKSLYCVDADTGAIQWTTRRKTTYSVLAMTPVLAGDGVFMTAPYGPPGRLHRLKAAEGEDGVVGIEEGWSTRLDSCQGGAVFADGRIFGAHYLGRKGWAALDAGTGEALFTAPDYAKGSAVFADGRLYALSEDGWMRLLEPMPDRFEERGAFRLAEARNDAWAHPVIHDGRLYLRYHDTLHCYDARAAR